MLPLNSIVAVYETQKEAQEGVRDLLQAGFDLKKLSVLGKEHESGEHVIGYYSRGSGMKYWGARGAFWNDVWKLLPGAACFVFPDIGPVLLGGPLTAWLVSVLKEPIADGLNAVGAALRSIGIPMPNILRYEAAIKMHKLLLIAYGTAQEVLRAKDVLHASRPDEINAHFAEEGVKMVA